METCHEADTRMVVHTLDALRSGLTLCCIRTVDTDVVVILLGKLADILTLHPEAKVWVAFGSGRAYQNLNINTIRTELGAEKASALPGFHAFTRCDTIPGFFGRGKKTAWETLVCYPESLQTFREISSRPFQNINLESPLFRTLERFVVALYDRSCSDESVNELRKKLFCLKSRPIERLPPTQDALLQHTKRACYQSGVWTVSLLHQPQLPSPGDFGWKKEEDSWKPVWMTQPTAAEACTELVKCKCTKGCGARCACKRADWSCTHFFSCSCVK